jgi:hypothetical protein
MTKFILRFLAVACLPVGVHAASLTGTIQSVFAGPDQSFGVRFYLSIIDNQASGVCNSVFVYTEPEVGSGHKEKVAVFTAAYLAGKTVTLTVAAGRDGYCKLVEGSMY